MYQELSGLYVLGKTIGSGGFGKVKLATHVATGEKVAIKIMNKKLLKEDLPRVYEEIKALKLLTHPNICKLYQVIESETHVFLVMEYCCGGELFDHIVLKEKLNEDEAKLFFRQIVGAVAYCHRQGYAHRDLKPENILLLNDQLLKIVDFGLCVRPMKGTFLETSCGSPNYAAPELLKGERYFGPQIDIWSLGVILYVLLCGNLPFDDETSEKLYAKILKANYDEPEWLSPESRSLIKSLLQIDPKQRLNTQALCSDPWLNRGFDLSVYDLSFEDEPLRRDEDCLRILGQYLAMSSNDVWTSLQHMEFDYNMATYRILLERKSARQPLRKLRRPLEMVNSGVNNNIKSPEMVMGSTYVVARRSKVTRGAVNSASTPRAVRPESIGGKRALKRIRSPGLEERDVIPKKIAANADRTPVVTPNIRRTRQQTPSSARRMLHGLEKGIRQVLTPQRSLNRHEPAFLNNKNMVNVTSTNSKNPKNILQELKNALQDKGIDCTVNGFILYGKLKRPGLGEQLCKLSFELEVCWIPQLSTCKRSMKTPEKSEALVGIRRKRLKGDAWIYKCVCEEVLAVAAAQ